MEPEFRAVVDIVDGSETPLPVVVRCGGELEEWPPFEVEPEFRAVVDNVDGSETPSSVVRCGGVLEEWPWFVVEWRHNGDGVSVACRR